MSFGDVSVRLLLTIAFVGIVYFLERILPRLLAGLNRRRAASQLEAQEAVEQEAKLHEGQVLTDRRWDEEAPLRHPVVAATLERFDKGETPADEEQSAPVVAQQKELPLGDTSAAEAFDAAMEIPHQFIPTWQEDGEYLGLIYAAAKKGHREAMNKLGEYAFRRMALVEAFYWKLKTEMAGGIPAGLLLPDITASWTRHGCPTEYDNVTDSFTEEQGIFARAVMRVQCGINLANAYRRLKTLFDADNADALRFVEWSGLQMRCFERRV